MPSPHCHHEDCENPVYQFAVLDPGSCHWHEALAAMLRLEEGRFKPDNKADRQRVRQLNAIIERWLRTTRPRKPRAKKS